MPRDAERRRSRDTAVAPSDRRVVHAANLAGNRLGPWHALFLSRDGVLRGRGTCRRRLAAARHDSCRGARIGDRERDGRSGRGFANSFCDGPRRQAARDPGQGAPALQDPLREHSRGRGCFPSGRIVLFAAHGCLKPGRQLWRADQFRTAAPGRDQPLFFAAAKRRLVAARRLPADGITDHRLRAV